MLASSASTTRAVEFKSVAGHGCWFGVLAASLLQLRAQVFNVRSIVGHREDQRLDLARLRLLVHVVYQVALALDTSVGDLTDLL